MVQRLLVLILLTTGSSISGQHLSQWFIVTNQDNEEDWLCWRALNRLRTGVGRAKTVMRKWGYLDDAQSVDCDCGEPQTMAHLLSCRLLDEACAADDLATVTERAKAWARKWEKIVWRTRKKKIKTCKTQIKCHTPCSLLSLLTC